jgi:hypothetical protein
MDPGRATYQPVQIIRRCTVSTLLLRRRFCRRTEARRVVAFAAGHDASSRCQIACTKATRQIPRPHIPLAISFQANPGSFRLPPCRSSTTTTVRKRLAPRLSGPKSGSERRILLAPNEELRVLISIIFKLRRKIRGRGAGGFHQKLGEKGVIVT